jgi:hypothetical protein
MIEIATALASVAVTGGSVVTSYLLARSAIQGRDRLLEMALKAKDDQQALERRARGAEDLLANAEARHQLAAAETTEARAMLATERARATRAEELLHDQLVENIKNGGPGAARREWLRLLARPLSSGGAAAAPASRDPEPDTAPLRPPTSP